MKEPPSSEEIEEAAIELAVDPSFIEKDWYAVKALELVVNHSRKHNPAIFSGGTSLSKGHGLIQRFSEDLDFVIGSEQILNRSERRAYRKSIIQEIELAEEFAIDEESVEVRDMGKFFSFKVDYPQNQKSHPSLRPYLKIEMSFRNLSRPAVNRPIRSFIDELKKEEARLNIPCVTPAETGADKFSALIWRILIKDRGKEEGSRWNEPQIIRHLHDLCAIESEIMGSQEFSKVVREKFPGDAKRGGFDSDYTIEHAANDMIGLIETDQVYRDEYIQFVKAMSYASESEKIDFDQASAALKRIKEIL